MNTSFADTNQFITLAQAVQMTRLYQAQKEAILKTEYQGLNLLARAETFNRTAFDAVLQQQGCTGLRIYYGMNEDLTVHAIIVGVDANGEDMLPPSNQANGGDGGNQIIEEGQRCPPYCPSSSPLNP